MKKIYRRSISGLMALLICFTTILGGVLPPLPLPLPAKWQNPIPLASPAVGMLILITAALGVMMSCII